MINGVDLRTCICDGFYDLTDRFLQIWDRALFGGDDLFPVPLVHIYGVKIVEFRLIAPDRVHIGVKAVSGEEIIAVQRHALPLRQRMNDLRFRSRCGNGKTDRALRA